MRMQSGERRAARFRPRPLAAPARGSGAMGAGGPVGGSRPDCRSAKRGGGGSRGIGGAAAGRLLPRPVAGGPGCGAVRAGGPVGGGWPGRRPGSPADREVRRIAAADRRRQDDGRTAAAFAPGAGEWPGTEPPRRPPEPRRPGADRAYAGSTRVARARSGCDERAGADPATGTVPARPAGGTGGTGRTDGRTGGPRGAGSGPLPTRLRGRAGGTQGQRPRVERRTMRPLLFMTPTVLPSVASFASWRSLSFATAMYTGPR